MEKMIILGFIICIIGILIFGEQDDEDDDPWRDHYSWNQNKNL